MKDDELETRIALALGSNVGDRRGHLAEARARLGARIHILRVSSLYETAPVGDPDQGPFLNAALTATTDLEPLEVLELIRDTEAASGRVRSRPNGPRTLDVDVVFYGDATIDLPGLRVPHPRWRTRGFVWAPLNEIAPDWVDPEVKTTVADLGRGGAIDLTDVRRIDEPDWARTVPC